MAGGALGDTLKSPGADKSLSDALSKFPMNTGGPGTLGVTNPAANPQASAAPTPASVAPWMQQGMGAQGMGQLGGQMMQAGQRPPLQPHPMMQRPPMGGAQNFAPMPGAPMAQQQLTPQMVNMLLARQTGLLGGGGGGQF